MAKTLNEVLLMGYIGTELKYKTTRGGFPLVNFGLNVPRPRMRKKKDGSPMIDFIPVYCWRGRADYAMKALRQKDWVLIHGELNSSRYVNGTNGKWRYGLVCNCRRFDILNATKKRWKEIEKAFAEDELLKDAQIDFDEEEECVTITPAPGFFEDDEEDGDVGELNW